VESRPNRRPGTASKPIDEVIDRARAGDQASLEMLYRDHVGMVYGYLRACGVSDPEDLTSEVFVGMLRGLSSFSGGREEFRTWLMTIAYRRMIDNRRRRSSDRSIPKESTDVNLAAIEAMTQPNPVEFDPRLIAAFSSLTGAQQEVLALRFVADFGLERVAKITGRPVGAVKSLQHRGLATLRNTLAELGFGREVLLR
jgi:RNA polymerase sigma-70 factor (ECF subfamily)